MMKRATLLVTSLIGFLWGALTPNVAADTGDGTVLSITKIQDSGPDTQRFNIVIMGDGYRASEMATFESQAQAVVNAFNNQLVYGACQHSANFYRVNIQSTDSGTDKPTPCYATSTLNDTYLDTRYCGDGSTQRCIGSSNAGLVQATANAATPNWHFVLVLVNDTEHGGCAWGDITYSSTQAGFGNTVVHELGHAIGDLADEYEEFAGTYSGLEPVAANLTIATHRAAVKWYDLILPTTAVPTWSKTSCSSFQNPPGTLAGVVGTFEGGGRHNQCGIYRPQTTCMMRDTSQPFCAACSRRVRKILMGLSSDANLSIKPWGYFRTPQTQPYWQTDDVWVDNDASGTQEADEPSIGKADNHLFARISNTGDAQSGTYEVRFSYVPFTGVIDMANAQLIQTISRPALALGGTDVVEVLWDLTAIPPLFAGMDHFCVIVEIVGNECATYDNRAQNNFANVPTVGGSPAPLSMYIKNITPRAATGRILVEPAPIGWEVRANVTNLDVIPLQPNEQKLIAVDFRYRGRCSTETDQVIGPGMAAASDGVCARQNFDLSFALDGAVLGGVSSNIIVHRPRYRWSASLHAGATRPLGSFDNQYGPGLMAGLDVDYHPTRRLSLVALLSRNAFSADQAGGSGTNWWNLSLNAKFELGSASTRPYVSGGLGLYIPKTGATKPGLNLGAGILTQVGPRTIFDAGADYHHVFTTGSAIKFGVGHVGLVIMF